MLDLYANEYHYGECSRTVGPRGGIHINQKVVRRNGQTQLWKTRPDDFRIPVKYGLRDCGAITSSNAILFHTPTDCPLNN